MSKNEEHFSFGISFEWKIWDWIEGVWRLLIKYSKSNEREREREKLPRIWDECFLGGDAVEMNPSFDFTIR